MINHIYACLRKKFNFYFKKKVGKVYKKNYLREEAWSTGPDGAGGRPWSSRLIKSMTLRSAFTYLTYLIPKSHVTRLLFDKNF
jgi:hypothetical protein